MFVLKVSLQSVGLLLTRCYSKNGEQDVLVAPPNNFVEVSKIIYSAQCQPETESESVV